MVILLLLVHSQPTMVLFACNDWLALGTARKIHVCKSLLLLAWWLQLVLSAWHSGQHVLGTATGLSALAWFAGRPPSAVHEVCACTAGV